MSAIRPITGYTAGVFDLFHIGHVNILRSARSLCDRLIVGVTIDELVKAKHKRAVIPFHERIEVVRACKYVSLAIPQTDLDKIKAWYMLKYDKLFVGDDWYKKGEWEYYEKELSRVGVDVIFFPYTQGTSSTLINETLLKLRNE